MQVALEKELRLKIQMLAAKADSSMKDWILDNILAVHRKTGMEDYLASVFGTPIILAPPTNADRFNIRIDDPIVDEAITQLAEKLQRTKPQLVYTLVTGLVIEKFGALEIEDTTPKRSLIA